MLTRVYNVRHINRDEKLISSAAAGGVIAVHANSNIQAIASFGKVSV
jgi:hypothetical protein